MQIKTYSDPSTSTDEELYVSWYASPFEDCTQGCGSNSMKFRKVTCRDVFSGAPSSACNGLKPISWKKCNCNMELCRKVEATNCPAIDEGHEDTAGFAEVGCFGMENPKAKPAISTFDKTCQKWANPVLCLGGLPFYSSQDDGADVSKCYAFCLGKSMDIFGIQQDGNVCRCGASVLNKIVWHESPPRAGLAFKPTVTSTQCAIRVYRYTGHYEEDGTPRTYWMFKENDLEYMESIVTGKDISEANTEDGLSENGGAMVQEYGKRHKVMQQRINGPYQLPESRKCWPGSCGTGNPWPNRTKKDPSGAARWQEYVIIPYVFADSLDFARKDTFRGASQMWMNQTCVRFVERTNMSSKFLNVLIRDLKGCSAKPCGYDEKKVSEINMGWCNNVGNTGNLAHELGHVLGLKHTHSRPDATYNYYGHGPYLKLLWNNIVSDDIYQYLPNNDTYTGSADDGPSDPHVGYAEYDFSSIMHYPAGGSNPKIETIPKEKSKETGNRQKLSAMDVLAINDMYQCVRHLKIS